MNSSWSVANESNNKAYFFVDTLALIKIGLTCFPKIALFISRKSEKIVAVFLFLSPCLCSALNCKISSCVY